MEHIRYIIIAILILLAYEDYKYLSVSLWKIALLVLACLPIQIIYIPFFILYGIFAKKISRKIAFADMLALFCCCTKLFIEEIALLFTLTGLGAIFFHKLSKKKAIPFMIPLLIAFSIITIKFDMIK